MVRTIETVQELINIEVLKLNKLRSENKLLNGKVTRQQEIVDKVKTALAVRKLKGLVELTATTSVKIDTAVVYIARLKRELKVLEKQAGMQ